MSIRHHDAKKMGDDYFFILIFFLSKWLSYSVDGLLSFGPLLVFEKKGIVLLCDTNLEDLK